MSKIKRRFNVKKITFGLIIINFMFFLILNMNVKPIAVTTFTNEVQQREVYLNIMTTDRMLYDMAIKIAGDKHNVQYMFKNKQQCYDYKFTEDSVENISNMDIFLYLGNGNEPWEEQFISKLKKGKVGIINSSRGIRVLSYTKAKKLDEYEVKENPNFYLSPEQYKIMLYNLKSAIQDKDPKNRDYYEENYKKINDEISVCDEKLNKLKALYNNKNIYTVDEELDYLTKYLSMNIIKLDITNLENEIKKMNKNREQENTDLLLYYGNNNEELIKKIPVKQIKISPISEFNSYIEYLDSLEKRLKENISKSTT